MQRNDSSFTVEHFVAVLFFGLMSGLILVMCGTPLMDRVMSFESYNLFHSLARPLIGG